MVFCNLIKLLSEKEIIKVTILILIDGFLQYDGDFDNKYSKECHNPYFNRWFSAIKYFFLGERI
mgnify:CR=1 FL=1